MAKGTTTAARETTSASGPAPRCPLCRGAAGARPANAAYPFCSERCRLIDLGAWFSGQRAIPGESAPQSENHVTEERTSKGDT